MLTWLVNHRAVMLTRVEVALEAKLLINKEMRNST